jgi:hypothetical protein
MNQSRKRVDLRTGELRESRQDDGITKCDSVARNNTACPRWLQFLKEATAGDRELIRFALLFVYGPGGNGKSVSIKLPGTVALLSSDIKGIGALRLYDKERGLLLAAHRRNLSHGIEPFSFSRDFARCNALSRGGQ